MNRDGYIIDLKGKIHFHKQNALNSKMWDNVLSTTSMILSALTALTMTILTVVETDAGIITIVGGLYAFTITVVNKVKDSYSFLALSFQHFNIQDQYAELLLEFENCGEDDSEYLRLLMNKYTLISQKSHIQSVQSCRYLFCCLIHGV